MHITPEYCRTMAQYNAWQNAGIRKIVQGMTTEALDMDRGAFFGTIRATLNHILWADMLWMNKFTGSAEPGIGMAESVDLTPNITEWSAERFRFDGRITAWAEKLRAVDLAGDLTWVSGVLGGEVTRPIQPLVMHFFNHQTHHRGQVHAMLTAAGEAAPVSDLFLMPETL